MIDVQHSIILIIVMCVVSAVLRFLPFALFPAGKESPAMIKYLGRVLPPAMIAMLVVYCFKGVSISAFPHGIPELISVCVVVALHIWKRNTLLSIVGGTLCYMVLIQAVFA